MKLKSDKGFLDFIASGRTKSKVIAILILGLCLILAGSLLGKEQTPKQEGHEERTAELCSMTEGVGKCKVMFTYGEDGESVFAVAILCEGGESGEVKAKLTDLICSLYGIGANRVTILKICE